jgi:uncharacterized protein (DUF58 family)
MTEMANALSPEVLKKIRRIEMRAGHLVNESFSGGYLSAFKGQGMEWEDVRAYVPGDDVRRIDWKVTARLGETQVKQYREERENVVYLLIDTSHSGLLASTGMGNLRIDLLAELAAALAFCATKSNDRLGVLFFDSKVTKHIPPGAGRNHVFRVIREILLHGSLAAGEASFKGPRLTQLLPAAEHLCRLRKKRTVVFVLSDLLLDDLAPAIERMSSRHMVRVFWMRDRLECAVPQAGLIPFFDAESGESSWIDCSRSASRESFAQAMAARESEIRKVVERSRAKLLVLPSDPSYIDQVIMFFSGSLVRQRPSEGCRL